MSKRKKHEKKSGKIFPKLVALAALGAAALGYRDYNSTRSSLEISYIPTPQVQVVTPTVIPEIISASATPSATDISPPILPSITPVVEMKTSTPAIVTVTPSKLETVIAQPTSIASPPTQHISKLDPEMQKCLEIRAPYPEGEYGLLEFINPATKKLSPIHESEPINMSFTGTGPWVWKQRLATDFYVKKESDVKGKLLYPDDVHAPINGQVLLVSDGNGGEPYAIYGNECYFVIDVHTLLSVYTGQYVDTNTIVGKEGDLRQGSIRHTHRAVWSRLSNKEEFILDIIAQGPEAYFSAYLPGYR